MGALLSLVKDEKLHNVHSKFYVILIILNFLLELAICGDEKNWEKILSEPLRQAHMSFRWFLTSLSLTNFEVWLHGYGLCLLK